MTVKVTLVSRTATATAKGVVPVVISCKAAPRARCRGKIDLDLFGLPAGSNSFNCAVSKRCTVNVKLKPKIWAALQKTKQKRLSVSVTITYKSGGKLTYATSTLKILGPRVRAKQGGTPPGK